MPTTYKNNSGVYSEEDLVVAVWFNAKKATSRPNARRLETFTAEHSPYPIAFPLETLQETPSWMYCSVARAPQDLNNMLEPGKATRENPLLVPLPLAKSHLGWNDFYVPTEYTERK
jgi:hypothetical protein